MKSQVSAIATLCIVALPLTASVAAPHTPKAGSGERQAIMDAMRKGVGKKHKKPIIFFTDHLKVEKGWAYFAGRFKYADGKSPGMDYAGGNTSAVLQYQNKGWRLKQYVHNSDVIEPELMRKFPQAPKAIFKRQ